MVAVGVIQARMGSTRLPGKVLEPIGHRPLVLWTLAAMRSVRGVGSVVVATSHERADDPLVEVLASAGADVHRGPVDDVLTRCWQAVAPLSPDFVVRQTADNPFLDPEVVAAQLRLAIDERLDYVGIAGWPLGIAGEVASWHAFDAAFREATDPAEREHVMPFIYNRPERFRVEALSPAGPPSADPPPAGRFTVDTPEDLEFARAIAERLGPLDHTSIGELRTILDDEPELARINAGIRQRTAREVGSK